MSLITHVRRPPDPEEPAEPEEERAGEENPERGTPAADRRRRFRVIRSRTLTVLAALLVVVALIFPNRLALLTPGAFLRIPVEALLGVGLVLILRPRMRPALAVLVGVALGLFTVMKIVDMGFYAVLSRPFDLVLDWSLFADAAAFVRTSSGRLGEIGAVIGVGLLVVGVPLVMTLSALRLTRLIGRHPTAAARSLGAAAVAWVALAAIGVQFVPDLPVASHSTAGLVRYRGYQVGMALQDKRAFAGLSGDDAFAATPPDQLLAGLRGKDVMLTFVESYGRSAIQDPRLAPSIDALLDAGTSRLAAAGFRARSGFLNSPTAGGGSWLAQATFLSGLWINNQQRFRSLTSSDRLTLTGAFKRANWQTVGVVPGVTRAWPEGTFYGIDRVYDSRNVGYRGPKFGWSTMPDQYALATFQRREHGRPGHAPIMAEIALTTSHIPWTPLPRFIDWDEVADGSVYGPMAAEGEPRRVVWRSAAKVRAQYVKSIEYALTTLISYLERYGDANTVLVFLGDHQPVPTVTGERASRDVPITIVAKDPAVLDRISGWNWHEGLNPGPTAPVWRMDSFRDRFLTAFGPPKTPAGAPDNR